MPISARPRWPPGRAADAILVPDSIVCRQREDLRRREGGRVIYWLLKFVVLGPWLRLLFRPHVQGRRHLPRRGPAILASNHLSFCDSIFLPLMVRRRVTFVAKQEYFTGKGLKGRLVRLFFVGVGTIPVDRSGGQAARAAIDTGLRVLHGGRLFGIYPEGTRSPDGRLYRGKTGVARLALESGAPVIPVAMLNSDEIQPIGKLVPRIRRARIRLGAPLDFSRYAAMAGDRLVERAITDEIMYELMVLSGREYVDVYAAKVKAAPQPSAEPPLATVPTPARPPADIAA
jgi:1-acyl-sn-glycerol-3-phosphate acyltransferase